MLDATLCRQLSIDFCCSEADVNDKQNHFTIHSFLKGRRRYFEQDDCFLKIAIVNGKLLFTGHEEIIKWCEEQFSKEASEWFLDPKKLRILDDKLHEFGYQLNKMQPYYIPAESAEPWVKTEGEAQTKGIEIRWYDEESIEQFRGDKRFGNAYTFCETAPDVIGVAAIKDGELIGMAGASMDSPAMWQIGIDVIPEARMEGIGQMLVLLLENEILRRGFLPYYSTGFAHFASQRVALATGFMPTWAEIEVAKIPE